ncbi:hypothetical protein Tco_0099083 [Tanacetum coccineum]
MHMLTPKPSSYYTGLGKSSFTNHMYLKKAQKEKPCLYNVKYDKNDLANLFAPESDETIRLAEESRSKLCKLRKRTFDHLMINIENIRSVVKLNWKDRVQNEWQNPITHDVKLLVKDMLIPLAQDTKSNASLFETHLKTEMFTDLKYVQTLKKEVDKLQTDNTKLLKEYDLILQECVLKDIMCFTLRSFDSLDEKTELQCLYLEKYQECEDLKTKLSKQNETVENKSFNELSKKFAEQKRRMYRMDTRPTQTRAHQLPQTHRNTNPRASTSTGVIHRTSVSRPQLRRNQMKDKIVQIILFIVDSGCTKHMTGNLKLLCNFVKKYLGTVQFGNDQFAPILGYGDLVQGNIMIKRIYYVKGLNHNLFSVDQLCDADLEVAFRKSTSFVRDL